MVSYNVYRSTSSGAYVEGVCLASDEKPVVGIANGSILYAVDASNGETTRYMYDKETMSWIEAECPCHGGSGSGGSGGGGVEPLIVNFVPPELEGPVYGDKTFSEIFEAASSGRTVVGKVVAPNGATTILPLIGTSLNSASYRASFAAPGMGEIHLLESEGTASQYPSIPEE